MTRLSVAHRAALGPARAERLAGDPRWAHLRDAPSVEPEPALPSWSWAGIVALALAGLAVWGLVLWLIGRALSNAALAALDAARMGAGG